MGESSEQLKKRGTVIKMERMKHGSFFYLMETPEGFDIDEKYPAIILLHGAGSRGNDISVLESNAYFDGTGRSGMPFITFAPQCSAETWFDVFEQLGDFVEYCISQPYVDRDRVYLMGASMGGYASWQMLISHPEWFAAAVPICGGGMYWNAGRLKNVGIWAFHGVDDNVVLARESEIMVEKINACGGNARLTLLEDTGHDSWLAAYNSKEVFEWLLSHTRGNDTDFERTYTDAKRFG